MVAELDVEAADPLDVFISYTRVDLAWAEWLSDLFHRKRLTTAYQFRDFRVGESFRTAIHKSIDRSHAVALVMSEAYFLSEYTTEEWTSAQEAGKKLVPIRVEECDPPGLLSDKVYIDLVGLNESEAEQAITDALLREKIESSGHRTSAASRIRPSRPGFPSFQHPVPAAPAELMGRDDYLNKIAERLSSASGPVAVIPDQPGAHGRRCTGLVAEYVRRHSTDFDVVCWINAAPAELLPLEFIREGRRLRLPPTMRTRDGVYEELTDRYDPGRSLVVFAAAPSRGRLKDWFPRAGVRCLVAHGDQSYGDAIALGQLTSSQARRTLADASGTSEADVAPVQDLLGGDPASVAVASRWFRATGREPGRYATLLGERIAASRTTDAAVRAVTLDTLEDENTGAVLLLALLAPGLHRGFPLAAFGHAKPTGWRDLDDVLVMSADRDKAVDALTGFGLVHEAAGLIVTGSRTGEEAARRLDIEERRVLAQAFSQVVTDALNDAVASSPELADQLAPHAYHLATGSRGSELDDVGGPYLALLRYLNAVEADDLLRERLAKRPQHLRPADRTKMLQIAVDSEIRSGDPEGAEKKIEQLLGELEDDQRVERHQLLVTLGRVRSTRANHTEACAALADAFELAVDDSERIEVLEAQYRAARAAGDLEAARSLAQARYTAAADFYGDDATNTLIALADRGSILSALGENGLGDLESAVGGLASDDVCVIEYCLDFARALLDDGQPQSCRLVLGRAAVIAAEQQGRRSPALAPILRMLADSYRYSDDVTRASVLERHAAVLAGEEPPPAQLEVRPPPDPLRSLAGVECVPILGPRLTEPFIGSRRRLARDWAEEMDYPMEPFHKEDLPHVAQYVAIRNGPTRLRQDLRKYFVERVLDRYRLALSRRARTPVDGENLAKAIPALISEVGRVARWADPFEYHRVMALLDASIYITTNASPLLVDALTEVGRRPSLAICNWLDEARGGARPSFYGIQPTKRRPLVLQLFGSFDEPGSVLLTERDYLDFVIRHVTAGDSIPHVVRSALVNLPLVFIGFDLDDWDFNVLLQGFIDQPGYALKQMLSDAAIQVGTKRELDDAAVQVGAKESWHDSEGAEKYLRGLISTKRKTEIVWQDLESLMVQLGCALGVARLQS